MLALLLCLQLYNVVVDTEMTGKKLLQKGELKRRYTIIPLNKISARAIDDTTVKRAQQIVSDVNDSVCVCVFVFERTRACVCVCMHVWFGALWYIYRNVYHTPLNKIYVKVQSSYFVSGRLKHRLCIV